ncbi:CoA transferase [Sporichthya sp.]|uniref:CaiB/BaiF CoA transferase family protein n=1 Tax=Sporichthya sp. TaxID=65475 RepID=UPI0018198264|nr:CoA transferase [Sporichthya sp.]MBA3741381.1 CoA transferase [Sporichthya sp.]
MAESALTGVRVVDLSRVVAGPLCAQMLGDHGADVVKVEAPAGDELRTYGPPFGPGTSAYFDGANRNKQNICLDLGHPAAREVLLRLLDGADVVIENFKSGTMDRWGLGYETLAAEHPELVYCRITGFGVDGPLGGAPGYDALLQAYAGLMSVTGETDGPPTRVGLPMVDLAAAMMAFSGILLALHERQGSGLGQLVDCTLLDSALGLLHPHGSSAAMYGGRPVRVGDSHGGVAPYQTFACRDGRLMIAANNNRQFARLCAILGLGHLAEDPRFVDNNSRVANKAALAEFLGAAVADRAGAGLGDELLAAGVPAAMVNEVPEVLDLPQVRHRNMVVELDDYRGIGIPIALTRTPGRVRSVPALRGADTEAVLARLGYEAAQIEDLIAAGAAQAAAAPHRELHPANAG